MDRSRVRGVSYIEEPQASPYILPSLFDARLPGCSASSTPRRLIRPGANAMLLSAKSASLSQGTKSLVNSLILFHLLRRVASCISSLHAGLAGMESCNPTACERCGSDSYSSTRSRRGFALGSALQGMPCETGHLSSAFTSHKLIVFRVTA